MLLGALGLAAALAVIVVTAGSSNWDPAMIAAVATLTIVSDLTSVETGSAALKVSGSFLGLMLAAVLLGGAPAAIIGMLTIGFGWLRWREAPHYLLNNLVTYAWAPLVGGLFFHGAARLAKIGSHELDYYLLVLATFLIGLALNFVGSVGYLCYLDRSSIARKAKETFAPLLASEVFSALLTLVAVYVAVQLGAIGLALFALVLIIFQYLAGQLLVSRQRSVKLRLMATTDDLTGLANRERFRTRVEQEIVAAGPFAVMLIDLDRFKEINDTLGHHYGDKLLAELGPRLAECIGSDGLVARLGGDEFAVLPGPRTDDPEVLVEVATRVIDCIHLPFAIDDLSLEIGASLGISRFPRDGEDANTLLRRADVAMYAAKEAQSGFELYAAEQDRHSKRRLSIVSDFRHAIDAGEIVVHYQPIVDLADLSLNGAESLVRWEHPEHGLLQPGAFIPIVEQTGLIGPLTRHVLERSIEQCAQWRRVRSDLSVSVNLSVRNLLDRDLPGEIERMLSGHGLPPEALRLEITESMIMSDPERALGTVERLSALGVRFSVDDFGVGYSSLAYLRRLPIAELKIDRSFVSPMLQDANDFIIVRSTINMGHDLGLTIIAEGVEDEPTLERLGHLGCDRAQGFHLSRPIPADAFADWIEQRRLLPVSRAA
jgi:diguanylate cyclase (GGDEF)-like protein